MLTNVERFRRVLAFQPVDLLPVLEWAHWWDQTLARWYQEGLPAHLTGVEEIRDYFGFDSHSQCWVSPRSSGCPGPVSHGAGLVANREEYLTFKKYLYGDTSYVREWVNHWAARHASGETVLWLSLEGPFWYPRTLLGIEDHLFAFFDQPELMREMNEDLLQFNLRVLEELFAICVPEFVVIAEDMSYNHGPMLSRELFDEFMAPFYRGIVPKLLEHGVVPFVDTDGDITIATEWFAGVGIQGLLPLERMAGVDIAALRQRNPRLNMIGAYDKTVMHLGEARVRQEFERILPVMRQGGYIPGVDHQTPPEVSLSDYRQYIRLLREYCVEACR